MDRARGITRDEFELLLVRDRAVCLMLLKDHGKIFILILRRGVVTNSYLGPVLGIH